MITAWRIVKRKHARTAFTGAGAREFGGRWNSPGVAIVYTAESQSLAALEMVVHLDSSELLDQYVILEVGIPEPTVIAIDRVHLPRNWRTHPPPERVQAIGNDWIRDGKSAVLNVPSATIPSESNYLLNPRHPDFPKLTIGRPHPFEFDSRLSRLHR